MFSTVLCIIAIKRTTHVSSERPLYRRTYRLSLCCSVTLRTTWTSICWRYAFSLRSNKVQIFEADHRGWLSAGSWLVGWTARGLGSSPVGLIMSWFAVIERFSFECRKVIGFAFTTLRDWFKKLAPLFIQSGVKPKPIVIHSYAFSHTLRQLHVITSRFDWFTWLSVSFVTGLSDYFGFGFTTLNWTLNWKPLYGSQW